MKENPGHYILLSVDNSVCISKAVIPKWRCGVVLPLRGHWATSGGICNCHRLGLSWHAVDVGIHTHPHTHTLIHTEMLIHTHTHRNSYIHTQMLTERHSHTNKCSHIQHAHTQTHKRSHTHTHTSTGSYHSRPASAMILTCPLVATLAQAEPSPNQCMLDSWWWGLTLILEGPIPAFPGGSDGKSI